MQDHDKRTKWVLDNDTEDLRGWPVNDADGRQLGTVAELMVDPRSAYVSELVLEGGRRISAHDVEVGERVLRVARKPAATAPEPAAKAEQPPPPLELAPKIEERDRLASKQTATTVRTSAPARPASEATTLELGTEDLVLQLIDEEIEIETRPYEAGKIHVETHIVSEPIAEEVVLKEERVVVERNPVDRVLDATDAERYFHDDAFEVKSRAELPVVRKTAHVVEEIVLKKDAFTRTTTVHDSVRHMDAEVIELRASEAIQGAKR